MPSRDNTDVAVSPTVTDLEAGQPNLFAEMYAESRKETGFYDYWTNEEKDAVAFGRFPVSIHGARKVSSTKYGNSVWEIAVECLGYVKLWGGLSENSTNDALGERILKHFETADAAPLTGVMVQRREYKNDYGDQVAYNFVPLASGFLATAAAAMAPKDAATHGDDVNDDDTPF